MTSGNSIEALRYFEQNYGKPWNELEVNHPPKDPCGDCIVACIIEWGHSQSLEKWSDHRPVNSSRRLG